jgi:hypothetical protein
LLTIFITGEFTKPLAISSLGFIVLNNFYALNIFAQQHQPVKLYKLARE